MAKTPAALSAKRAAKRIRTGPTFIQRSRSTSSEEKAMYHNVTGAGRSHVKRPFLGFAEDDQQAIKAGLEALIAGHLANAGR